MADAPDDEREEELSSITAIFPELVIDASNPYAATLSLPVTTTEPLAVFFPPSENGAPPIALPTPPNSENDGQKRGAGAPGPTVRDVHHLSHLPPIHLQITLPDGYPEGKEPHFKLSASPAWIPADKLQELGKEGTSLWEEYGHGQVVFAYIDFLQQAAERAFNLADNENRQLSVPLDLKIALLDFDIKAKRAKFEQETFDCGICLEPKKGSACYKLVRCGHVFCVQCLQDFYNDAITSGDVSAVKCLDPECGIDTTRAGARRRNKKRPNLNPSELLQIPLEHATVKRYVDLKHKKKLEADTSTVYCPRKWCQAPARSKKYPKHTDLTVDFSDSDSEADENTPPAGKPTDQPDKEDRLRICEDCNYAFCRVCLAGWHGEYFRCWPRTAEELTEDEQASYNFIRQHTSPCPSCSVPTQKTMGCNHMRCFQCNTHFCYLCGSWLDSHNPYQHFNKQGTPCYQQLWVLEEGDDGNNNANFHGVRGWEAAVAAQEQELADAQEGDEPDRDPPPPAPEPPRVAEQQPPLVVAMNQLNIGGGQPPAGARGNGVAPPIGAEQIRQFLEMARNDDEDGWDSDELEGDFDHL